MSRKSTHPGKGLHAGGLETVDLRGLVHQRRGEAHIYIHPERPIWAAINRFGHTVISLCDGQRSTEEIASHIARKAGAGPEDVLADVRFFLDQVRKVGLLSATTSATESTQGPGLQSLFLHLTSRCNLKCTHCYIEASPGRRADMPHDRVLRLIDSLADLGGNAITLSGGEALVREDIEELIRYAAKKIPKVQLLTNGTLIDSRMAGTLAACGVHVQVSIDSPRAEAHDAIRGRGAWMRAIRGIEALREAGVSENLNLCLTVTKLNIADVGGFLELAASRGIALVRMIPLEKTGRGGSNWRRLAPSRAELDRFYRSIYLGTGSPDRREGPRVSGGLSGMVVEVPDPWTDASWCPVGKFLAIDAEGAAYPCSVLMYPDFKLGNVTDSPIGEIFSSTRLAEIKAACRSRRNTIEKCGSCPWRSLCQGGCPGVAYTWSGTIATTDGLCKTRKHLFREILFGLAEAKRDLQPAVTIDIC